jgi:hypothetical protein
MNRPNVTITDTLAVVRPKSILLKRMQRTFTRSEDQPRIAESLVIHSDTDLDEIEAGDKITIEIPAWLAEEKGVEG